MEIMKQYLLWNLVLFENYGQEVGGPIHCWCPKTWQKNVPNEWLLETRLFRSQKVKGQGHESQQVCVGFQTECSIAAGCIRKPRRVFPAAVPAAPAMLATSGFPWVTSLLRDISHARQTDRRFSRAWSFFAVTRQHSITDGHTEWRQKNCRLKSLHSWPILLGLLLSDTWHCLHLTFDIILRSRFKRSKVKVTRPRKAQTWNQE